MCTAGLDGHVLRHQGLYFDVRVCSCLAFKEPRLVPLNKSKQRNLSRLNSQDQHVHSRA